MRNVNNPYRLSDQTIQQINRAAMKRKNKAKAKMLLNFDELNVLKQVDSMYSDINKTARNKYKELWAARFLEVTDDLIEEGFLKKEPKEDEIDELVEMHLAGLLEKPNETTNYTYSHEIKRKRDKAKEAILSVPTKAQKQLLLDKHNRYLAVMMDWYADFTSQDAEISAYKEAGIERVQRHEQNDDRVCAVCKAADGEIYKIDSIPPLPHVACRRYFTHIQ